MKNTFTTHAPKRVSIAKRSLMLAILLALMLFCIDLSAQNVWMGTTNTDWATATNWSVGSIPLSTEDVVIPTTGNDPIISGATAAVAKSVTVQSGAQLTVTGSLTIDGSDYFAIHNQGTVNNNGTLNLGTVTSVANQGILNYGTFNNNSTGEINIDRAFAGISNYTGTFTNLGTLTIGEVSGIIGPGIYNEAAFTNGPGAEMHIINTLSSGLYNLVGSSFSNDGLLALGLGGSITGPAIYNFVDFTNGAAAEIKIENSFYGIDHRSGATFDNLGVITIGANAPVRNSAIFNEAIFNNTGATIIVDSARVAIDNRSTGVFNHSGTLTIGANHSMENIGIFNQGELTNDGGEITIDRIFNQSGFHNDYNASVDNSGTITIGGVANVSGHGLLNYGLFENQSTAEISINRITSPFSFSNINGIYNGNQGTFHNWGKLWIGNEAGSFNHGLYNVNIFQNYSGAEITIDRIEGEFSTNALYNERTFTNAGSIHIGDVASAGKYGLFNGFSGANFNNDGGEITINNVQGGENTHAMYIESTFTNSGTIRIGNIANESDWGLFNTGTLNNTGGTITIDNTALAAMRNQYSATVNNSGQIRIGQSGAVGDWGLWNYASSTAINNEENGVITIDQTAMAGLLNQDGTFNNYGSIRVGTNAGVTQYAFWNDVTFNNFACGTFEIAAAFSNEDVFTNTGLMIVNTAAVHANTGFENDGVIVYPQNNPIPNVTNNEIIVTPVSTDCGEVTPALDLAAMIDLTIATTWYQDEALTMVAGTYDQPSNTFTFTASPAATTSTLYFSATSTTDGCSMTVPIEVTFTDGEAPTISCPATQTLVLGEDCTAMLGDYTALATANDNCEVVALEQSPEAGNAVSGVGNETITLTAYDLKGLSNSCTFTVEKVDQTAPTALCQNTTVQLDANGMGSISTDDIDNGSSDGCGLAAIDALTLDITSFTCVEVGDNTVTLTVLDANGNDNFCTANVRVEDNISPSAVCQNITIQLDMSGAGSTTAMAVDNGSGDACGIDLALSQTEFDCSHVGSNSVTLTVTDDNDNSSTCNANVTVEDNISPTAICQNATVQLDENGEGTISTTDINNNSNDACGIASLALSQSAFDCSEAGSNTVVLTVTDNNGNTSTCTANVAVEDNEAPVALCQNLTIQLDANGMASVSAMAVDNGSSDNCDLAAMDALTLDITSFTCAEVGDNTVTLTVLDDSGNDNSCTATVTVEDNSAPTITTCEGNFAVFNGEESIDASTVISLSANDACGSITTTFAPSVITCDQLGSNVNVLVTVTDLSGNANTCTAVVKTDGLPCGFMDFGDDGIDCEDSSTVEYDTESESFTLTSDGCATNNFSQDNAAYTFAELCGNGEIIAHVTGISPIGQGWAGITLRETEAPGSKKVELLSNLGNMLRRAIRTTTNGYAYPAQFFRPQSTWLKLVRSGNLFIGYASFDGINWQNVLFANIPMNTCIQAGLMVTNYNGSTVVSGTFDNVEVNAAGSMNLQLPENEDAVVAQDITLYPNPTKDQIFIDLNSFQGQEIELTIFNQQGQMISSHHIKEVGSSPEELDVNEMTSGSYYIQISTDKGEIIKRFSIVK